MKRNNSRAGFSLVELAIVLVIIGLIVGGVLKGQDLIQSARVNSVQTDLNKIRTAVGTFQDKYVALPGDMTSASMLDDDWDDGDGNEGGDGNGRVGEKDNGDWTTGENAQFWAHLSAAGLLNGVVAEDIINNGGLGTDEGLSMSTPIGGFYKINYDNPNSSEAFGDGDMESPITHWVFLGANADDPYSVGSGDGVISPIDLRSIDLKADDGDPRGGDITAANTGGSGRSCIGSGEYKNSEAANCVAFFAL